MTPVPTPTLTPTLRPTSTPTAAPSSTPTPSPTPTGTPTPTPSPTAIPLPTATSTPRPPTPTPTPSIDPADVAAGLGYARAEGLEGSDADTYARHYAQAVALGLPSAYARDYTAGLMYHVAIMDGALTAAAYLEAFQQAPEGSPAETLARVSEAVRRGTDWWPFSEGEGIGESYAGYYAEKLVEYEGGISGHLRASVYAGRRYLGLDDTEATDWVRVAWRGYDVREPFAKRIDLVGARLEGYDEALWRAEPEQGYTEASKVDLWAAIYAKAYVQALARAKGSGWDQAQWAAYRYAILYTSAKVDRGFSDQDAYLNADAFYRGVNAAIERGVVENEAESYAWDYYSAYWDQRVVRGWSQTRADIFATAYAEARLLGVDLPRSYAEDYEEAYTAAVTSGATEVEAHTQAEAFARARAGI